MISSMVRLCGIQGFRCSLPALQPHSSLPLDYFYEFLPQLSVLLMAENIVHPQHTQLDVRPGILSMTLYMQYLCGQMLVHLRSCFK